MCRKCYDGSLSCCLPAVGNCLIQSLFCIRNAKLCSGQCQTVDTIDTADASGDVLDIALFGRAVDHFVDVIFMSEQYLIIRPQCHQIGIQCGCGSTCIRIRKFYLCGSIGNICLGTDSIGSCCDLHKISCRIVLA